MNTTTPILHYSSTPTPSVRLFTSAQSWIEDETVRQLYATARLDGVQRAVGFPDLHPGKGTPVGAAFVTEGVINPHRIGGDIGCGMALFKTGFVRRDAKLDRWAASRFDLEHPWDQFVGDAKAVVVGMSSNGFTLADPNDRGMLNVVGLDMTVPAVIADFVRS